MKGEVVLIEEEVAQIEEQHNPKVFKDTEKTSPNVLIYTLMCSSMLYAHLCHLLLKVSQSRKSMTT